MNSAFFSDLLTSIADRGRVLLKRADVRGEPSALSANVVDLCHALLSGRGEASATAVAREVLDRYGRLDTVARLHFFETLAEQFGPKRARLQEIVESWRSDPTEERTSELHFASEPRRQELFRRLNRAPGGTAALVQMRADLLALKGEHKKLAAVDRDLAHLLGSWFNRGFLVLRSIDWSTPAIVLEKIIRYEAVHAIGDWEDLRRRIDPDDRRCYAFFHPALVDEPLIFVEVALTGTIPAAIAPLLAATRVPADLASLRTAVFYSISNCQRGLDGISFGNFLIKQVVEELQRELPQLDTFVTLSPMPGFIAWLTREREGLSAEERALTERLEQADWAPEALNDETKRVLEPLAAYYLTKIKTPSGRPRDPVARFHLGNGARLERIDWLGDRSPNALREAAGLMVNYLYDLDHIERNHEAFVNQGKIASSASVRRLLRVESKARANGAASLMEP